MSAYLLDTNVLSEMTRREPNIKVKAFLDGLPIAYVSIISVHELNFGLEALPMSQRRTALANSIQQLLTYFENTIISINVAEAKAGAALRASAQALGRVVDTADGLIAGTALVHGLTIVTRNEKDFSGLGVSVLNPWT